MKTMLFLDEAPESEHHGKPVAESALNGKGDEPAGDLVKKEDDDVQDTEVTVNGRTESEDGNIRGITVLFNSHQLIDCRLRLCPKVLQ